MSYPLRRLTMPIAIAALMSAPLIAAPFTVAHAQTKPVPAAPQAKSAASQEKTAATQEKGAGIEQRITQLHAELKITPDQESKWNSVAQAMRDNAAKMDKLVADKRQQGQQNMTAVDDLKTYEEFTQTHLDGIKNLTSAFSSLYDSMSDAQKKNADQVFAKFNRANAPAGAPNRNG